MSNVYKKLQKCRAELKKLPIKESGNNKFAGYTYMELGDFLPHIVDLCNEYGLCTIVSFTDIATLTVVNADKPDETIVFTSPMSTAELKGCHAIQNLGAVETYLRRYLYVNAFDIVEHDALDSIHGSDNAKPAQQPKPQAPKPPAEPAQLTEKHAEYQTRIKTALKAIFGDDKQAALDEVERLTVFTTMEGKEVAGKRDFTKLSEKAAGMLAHALEKRLKDMQEGDIPF